MSIQEAVQILKAGGLVAMPTETVYGLAADAQNPAALRKIFLTKQRPSDHPLIVHLADASQLDAWAREISPLAWKLAEVFWPGPLTLILKKAPGVSDLITGGQDTIGVRVPHHPVAQALLSEFGSGLAAPSANRFGRISPTTAQAVWEELGDGVDLILEGGQCAVGVESTIVDVSGDQPAILRPGMITAEQIARVAGCPIAVKKQNAPRVSGSHEQHYAPVTVTRLMNVKNLPLPVGRIAWVGFSERAGFAGSVMMKADPLIYAHDLYQVLRELDKQGFEQIWIEDVPEGAEWDAIRDRLVRACVR